MIPTDGGPLPSEKASIVAKQVRGLLSLDQPYSWPITGNNISAAPPHSASFAKPDSHQERHPSFARRWLLLHGSYADLASLPYHVATASPNSIPLYRHGRPAWQQLFEC